jgi:hypothetical protein
VHACIAYRPGRSHVATDTASAQVYAILSLEETLRNVASQLAELIAVIRPPDR